MQRNAEQNPLILTFLQQNRIPELIRLMFNRKTAEQYLRLYGAKPQSSLRQVDQLKIQNYVARFQVSDMVQLKGSQKGNIRHHCNTFISDFLTRKIAKGHKLTMEQRRIAFLQLTDYYQLENLYEGLSGLELPPQVAGLISKDVNRTYLSPDFKVGLTEEQVKMKEAQMRGKLTEVLERIAKYNPYIGYCQGMNNIGLFLLQIGWSPAQAFFVFKKITEEILPCDFYASMDSTIAMVRLLFQVLHHTHPRAVGKMKKIIRHMQGQDRFLVTLSFVFQWFVCLFTNVSMNRGVRLAIMDRLLLEGTSVLIKAALAFFDVLQEPIQKVNGIQDYMPEVDRRIREFNDLALLEKRLSSTYINTNIMQLLREKLVLQGRGTRKRQSKDNCNPRWNICLQTVQDHLASGSRHQFFVFRTNEELRMIDNYFQKFQNQHFRIGKTKNKTDLLRLGRMPHSCRRSSSKTNDDDNSKRSVLEEYSQEGISAKSYSHSKEDYSPSKRGIRVGEFQTVRQGERRQIVRSKALQSLQNQRKSVISRSESVQFMRSMIQNESFSNLLEILEEDEMENIFRSVIEEDQQ